MGVAMPFDKRSRYYKELEAYNNKKRAKKKTSAQTETPQKFESITVDEATVRGYVAKKFNNAPLKDVSWAMVKNDKGERRLFALYKDGMKKVCESDIRIAVAKAKGSDEKHVDLDYVPGNGQKVSFRKATVRVPVKAIAPAVT
jgi:hypothetical protein